MVVEIPEGFKMPLMEDDKTSVSGFSALDKKINLADNKNKVAGTYATMVHLEDSLNGDDQSNIT
jgi:hypothetical protein